MSRTGSVVFGIAALVAVAFAACSSDTAPDKEDGDDVGGSAGTSGSGPGGESGDDGGAGSGTGGSEQGGSGQGGTTGEGGEGASSGSGTSGSTGSGGSESGGASGSGSGGLAGSGGTGTTVGCDRATLLDDFEDMNSQSCPPLLKEWWAWLDSSSTGTITPSSGMLMPQALPGGSRNGSVYGMHLSGTGFSSGAAALLVDVRETDLSMYQGVRVWTRTASAAVRIRIEFATRNTVDTTYGGSCVASGLSCWDHYGAFRDFGPAWQIQDVSFAQLAQEGWGLPVAKDLAHVFEIRFYYKTGGTPANPSSFDFWIDDVEFY